MEISKATEEEGRWLDWLRNYEAIYPEPDLGNMVANKFLSLGTGYGYRTMEVDRHMVWHRKMTDAWMSSGLAKKWKGER